MSPAFDGSPRTIRPWAEHLAGAGWYREAERAFADLGQRCQQQLPVYQSAVDHVVGPNSMKALRASLPGAGVRPLDNGHRAATLHNDVPIIVDGTLEWIKQHQAQQRQAQAEERA
jgi:hypothetical protein